jgi:hypothetical protein
MATALLLRLIGGHIDMAQPEINVDDRPDREEWQLDTDTGHKAGLMPGVSRKYTVRSRYNYYDGGGRRPLSP